MRFYASQSVPNNSVQLAAMWMCELHYYFHTTECTCSVGMRLDGRRLEVTAMRRANGPQRFLLTTPCATLTHTAVWFSRGVCCAGSGASL